jgi:hypothetical protein
MTGTEIVTGTKIAIRLEVSAGQNPPERAGFFILSLRSKPLQSDNPLEVLLRLMQAARRASRASASGFLSLRSENR